MKKPKPMFAMSPLALTLRYLHIVSFGGVHTKRVCVVGAKCGQCWKRQCRRQGKKKKKGQGVLQKKNKKFIFFLMKKEEGRRKKEDNQLTVRNIS